VARAQSQELREAIGNERAQVADAKRTRRERLQAITAQCRAMREAHSTDSKRQRAELRAAIEHARDVIKNKCARARGKTDEETAGLLVAAIGELEEARDRLRIYLGGLKLPPKDPGKVRGGVRAAEVRAEVVDEVASNLEGSGAPELVPVWRNMARRLPKRYRASDRRSSTEGFLEWAADHAGAVADIQDKLLQRSVTEWTDREEEQQREAHEAGEVKRKRELRKLTKLTGVSVSKLGDEQVVERFEQVAIALQDEDDAEAVAQLRRAGDILQGDLMLRGLLDYNSEREDAPDEGALGEAPF
jgi:hypothetical protein